MLQDTSSSNLPHTLQAGCLLTAPSLGLSASALAAASFGRCQKGALKSPCPVVEEVTPWLRRRRFAPRSAQEGGTAGHSLSDATSSPCRDPKGCLRCLGIIQAHPRLPPAPPAGPQHCPEGAAGMLLGRSERCCANVTLSSAGTSLWPCWDFSPEASRAVTGGAGEHRAFSFPPLVPSKLAAIAAQSQRGLFP